MPGSSPAAGSSEREKNPGLRVALRVGAGMLIALLWLQFALSLPGVRQVRTNDFPAYWAAGRTLLAGEPEQMYSEKWKWFTNLPVVAVLCVPLALLEYETAWGVLWWISVASFALLFALLLLALKRHFPPLDLERAALVALVFFAFAPVMRRCLTLGQTTPLLVMLFCVVYLLVRAGYERSGGLLLGLICVIKIPPMLLLPLLLLRGRFAVAVPAIGVVLLAFAVSWLAFGTELMQHYADRVIWDNFGRVHAAFNNQSIDGALMRVLSSQGLTDWVPVERPAREGAAAVVILVAIAAALIARGRGLLLSGSAPRDDDAASGSLELEFGLGVALMVLVFPIVWIHYYLFLLVPLALLPFWWQARGGGLGNVWICGGLFVVGTWLAGGAEVHENAWYAARSGESLVRWSLTRQPLGAILLVASLAIPLREIARRQRANT
jgi:alpha-1,2-mannosyltransferase